MPLAAALFRTLLCRLVRCLVLLLDRRLTAREAWLLATLRRLPPDHRHRRGLEAELARLRRARDVLANAGDNDDPRLPGLMAEVARVRNDAGRRALPRRRIHPNPFFALPSAHFAPALSQLEAPEERCTPCLVVP